MENNPYAAPRATLDLGPADAAGLERQKASRGKRLGGALIDGLCLIVAVLPIAFAAGTHGQADARSSAGLFATIVVLGLGIFNLILLYRSGQSIGKKIIGTKIVRTDGSPASLARILFLRIVPMQILSYIPYLGGLIALTDALVIFGKDVRCLHDQIADTIVIDIRG